MMSKEISNFQDLVYRSHQFLGALQLLENGVMLIDEYRDVEQKDIHDITLTVSTYKEYFEQIDNELTDMLEIFEDKEKKYKKLQEQIQELCKTKTDQ